MKNWFVFIWMLLILISCRENKGNPFVNTLNLPDTKMEYLQTIVGQLSGNLKLPNGNYLKARWSREQRETTRTYLKGLLKTVNIEPKENEYLFPNLNPAIDFLLAPYKGCNIYGVLPASQPSSEYVVLGAHYDTGKWNAPGAIDNATGIALIYSVVKELSQRTVRDKNIVLVFFDQEEEELIGSQAFAKFLKRKQWEVHSVHCFDMVGWDMDNDQAMEAFSASESLLRLYDTIAIQQDKPLNKITVDPNGETRISTDFDSFVQSGFEVIGAGECYYHKDSTPHKDGPNDTFETVNFPYLRSCSSLIEEIMIQII